MQIKTTQNSIKNRKAISDTTIAIILVIVLIIIALLIYGSKAASFKQIIGF